MANHGDAAKHSSYDTRKYQCCAPYYGKRGPAFTRRFKPEFVGSLHGHGDRFNSVWDHFMRQDCGAQPINPNLPMIPHPGNANTTIRLESELAYTSRSKKLYSLIWTHVEDVDMRAQLETVAGNGLAAWALLEQMANLPTTGLTQVNQDNDWNTLKLSDVGVTEDTITRFVGHMNRVNADRVNPFDEEARRIRLLSVRYLTFLI